VTVVQGERRFAAPPERVFAVLTDPDVIASAMPAVRSHRVVDDDHWQAKVKPPLPLAPSLTVRFEVLDRAPRSMRLCTRTAPASTAPPPSTSSRTPRGRRCAGAPSCT
jgi:carbon monoxide dehydrogenase subunit G